MSDPKTQQQATGAVTVTEASDFMALMNKTAKVKPQAQSAVAVAVATLAERALDGVRIVDGNAIATIKSIIAEIDRKLSEQINQIIHHPDFQALESTWTGLFHLVKNTETDQSLKIRVLNVSKKEAAKSLKSHKAAWDQSPLFKKIYGAEFDVLGGTPYGCLIGDYAIENEPGDIEFLDGMAQIAAAAHAPFISSAAPSLLNMDSWQELSEPRDLAKIQETPEFAQWKAFRKKENAAYVGLCMPRFLGRLPYGEKSKNPLEAFAFEEDTDGKDHSKYLWANAAYAMGANITRSFKLYGWCARIRGVETGGTVEELPCHTFPTDDGGIDMKCPTELAIGDRRGAELDKLGLMPLYHRKGTTDATFIGAQSASLPAVFEDPDATANANMTARLYYMFPVCRFAHYLKAMVRDKIGSFKDRDDMERWLNNWIANYVSADPNPPEEVRVKLPLAAAEVKVQEIPGNPGYYAAQFFLRPHYQLEGLNVSLRLTSKLPSVKKGG